MHEPVTMDDWDADERRAGATRPFWPVWIWPLLVWLPLDAWHARFARDLPRLDHLDCTDIYSNEKYNKCNDLRRNN